MRRGGGKEEEGIFWEGVWRAGCVIIEMDDAEIEFLWDDESVKGAIMELDMIERDAAGFKRYAEFKRLAGKHVPQPRYSTAISIQRAHVLKTLMQRHGITQEMHDEKTSEYVEFIRKILKKETKHRILYGRRYLETTLFRIKKLPSHAAVLWKHREWARTQTRNRPYLFERRKNGDVVELEGVVFYSRTEYMQYVNSILARIEHISELKRAFEWKGRKLTKEWVLQIALDEAMESVLELLKPTSLPEDFGQRRLNRARNQVKREEIKKEIEEVRERIEKKMKKWSLEPAAHDA